MTFPFGATALARTIVSDPEPIPASKTVSPYSIEQLINICAASLGRII